MSLDFATLENLRSHHPAWRLLRSDHAPLIASFLQRSFVEPNLRTIAAPDLAEALEDELFALREQRGEDAFPRAAMDYLNDWAEPDKGWLRKFYRAGSDEPQFDLTPATEKALGWLTQLTARSFVGTESRLRMLFELLKAIHAGSDADPARHLAELEARRAEINAEIERVRGGDLPLLDDTAIKDRFQQFMQLARELLGDFREVEHNFRQLDRRVRERIALWDGPKAELLDEVMGERDVISDSDQGRSFRAFWEFLMSSHRQEELSDLLEWVLTLDPVQDLAPDARLRRVHYDWLEAGEHTQRTVAQLSQQLRRFLDDQAWLENRRIMDILHGIETRALALREHRLPEAVTALDKPVAAIELPLERPLYQPPRKPRIDDLRVELGTDDAEPDALFEQVVIDRSRLQAHVTRALQRRRQISLRELIEAQPLERGLAELIAYLELGSGEFTTLIDDSARESIHWQGEDAAGRPVQRRAELPRVVFAR